MDIWLIYIFIANNMVEESYLYKEKDYVYIVAILNIYKEMYVNIIYMTTIEQGYVKKWQKASKGFNTISIKILSRLIFKKRIC